MGFSLDFIQTFLRKKGKMVFFFAQGPASHPIERLRGLRVGSSSPPVSAYNSEVYLLGVEGPSRCRSGSVTWELDLEYIHIYIDR